MKPISIIIPCFNAADTLESVLRSCLAQTGPAKEIIVVDDGSSDDPASVCAHFGDHVTFKRIENGGVSRARNVGAGMASGQALVFLDADDLLLPHALTDLEAALQKANAGMAYGMVIERAEPPAPPRLNGFNFAEGLPPVPAKRNFWRSAVITPGSAIVSAELHRRVGGFVTGYEPLEDRDYWNKCGLLSAAAFCDTVVLDKTWRPSSHGSQHAKRIFRGQRAQRDLKLWCAAAGLDAAWMPDDGEIIKRALDEALWRREFGILPALLEAAEACKTRHWKASLTAKIFRHSAPSWINEEPRCLEI